MRRNIGRIGLHHQGIQRQLLRQLAQVKRAFIGQCTTKSKLETHLDEDFGLLHAAVERMGNAATNRQFAQALEQLVGGTAHMQDHRQVELARQLQLRAVEKILLHRVEPGHKIVESDLANRH